MKKYQHIFFDIDDTIWDFRYNANQSLEYLFQTFELEKLGSKVTLDNFKIVFQEVNQYLWHKHNLNQITKEEMRYERFLLILNKLDVPKDKIPFQALGETYLKITPIKTKLVENCLEILNYLRYKNYKLHIITNGFEDIQYQKLRSANVLDFFDLIITSEQAKVKKPHPQVFDYAIQTLKIDKKNCLMIGDSLSTDIEGAKKAGWNSVWYNIDNQKVKNDATYEIKNLIELKDIL
jgi:putative hydrolase of the HAD superfamily